MHQHQEPARDEYPHGRGYGHDYMRGGEVLGGYGYSEREEYTRTRGEQHRSDPHVMTGSDQHATEAPPG